LLSCADVKLGVLGASVGN